MANSTTESKVAVNGDSSGWDPTLQDKIILALADNGGLKRIRATLQQRLDEAGWSEDLRKYCTALFRSGAATTYDDARAIITRRMEADMADPEGVDDGVPAPNLLIPDEAKYAGADAVKKELRGVLNMKPSAQNGGQAGNTSAGTSTEDSDLDAPGSPDLEASSSHATARTSNGHAAARIANPGQRVSPPWRDITPLNSPSTVEDEQGRRRSGRRLQAPHGSPGHI